jgi:hypothetical protein
MRSRSRARFGATVYQFALIALVVVAILALIISLRPRKVTSEAGGSVATATNTRAAGALPYLSQKPTPREITFDECPPEGDGPDHELDRLKNRVDEGSYISVSYAAIDTLPWPRAVDRERRSRWSRADSIAVALYEGIPVAVEGYLAGAKVEGPEATNCHAADPRDRDWHIWLTGHPGTDRSGSIVVEATPRVRAAHPHWRFSAVRNAARDGDRVRISGWLMLDPDHPEQLGKTRGTLWEIHPIMNIELQRNGRWTSLDSVSVTSHR